MKHDYKKIGSLLDQSNIPAHLYVDEITEVVKGYSEHQDRWLTTNELPESDTFVTLLCTEEFNGMSDHPITAHYCKDRNLFAENGEEIPHEAIRFYKVVTMPESPNA